MTGRSPTAGVYGGLQQISTPAGHLAVVALDHRDSLRAELAPDAPESVVGADLTAFKADVLAGVADRISGVMLEPEYSIPDLVGLLPDGVGFLCALEAQGYLDDPAAGPTTLLPGWGADRAKAAGASVAKLLVHDRPDDSGLRAAQQELVAEVARDCEAADLALVVEPLPQRSDDPSAWRSHVIGSAQLAERGGDLLKLPFPGGGDDAGQWASACRTLDDATGGRPWALLSGGQPFELFERQLSAATTAGCSGFMVGRALWREVVDTPRAERRAVARRVARPRLVALNSAGVGGQPWTERILPPATAESWAKTP